MRPTTATITHYGLKFDCVVRYSVDDANEFMTNTPGWGALCEGRSGAVYMARLKDKGERVPGASPFQPYDGE